MGLKKKVKKDPGIPNSWPFKAEMLQELEKQKEEKDKEMQKRRVEAKRKAKSDQSAKALEAKRSQQEAAEDRRQKRLVAVERQQLETLRRTLSRADVLLQVLDARDPMGCRCAALEGWAHENGKRVVFVLAKADLVPPQLAARWLKALGQVGPTLAVQVEAGREGVSELLSMIGQGAETAGGATGSAPSAPSATPCKAVGVVGYPGTGKQSLCRALRREARGLTPWLLEPVCRLRPQPAAGVSPEAALHRMVCPAGKQGGLGDTGAEPQAVLGTLLSRVAPAQLARRLRLPGFEGLEKLCDAFAQDRKLTTKRGNKQSLEVVSKRVLAELAAPPGLVCSPPEAQLASSMWVAHGEAAAVKAIMEAQHGALSARADGSAGARLALGTPVSACGPPVDLAEALAGGGEETEGELEDSDDDMEDECDGEGEEGEEEEGEESEEEDAGMSDEE